MYAGNLKIVLIISILLGIAMIVFSSIKLQKLKHSSDSNTESIESRKKIYTHYIIGGVLLLILCLIVAYLYRNYLFYEPGYMYYIQRYGYLPDDI